MKTIWYSIFISIGLLANSITIYSQEGCKDLKIVSAEDTTIDCIGPVTLKVIGSEKQGTGILWYESFTDENWFYEGSTYETPLLTESTSYWVTDAVLKKTNISRQGRVNPTRNSGEFSGSFHNGLLFEAYENFKLKSVDVYSKNTGILDVSLFDSSNKIIATKTFNIIASNSPITLALDFNIKKGEVYRLLQTTNPTLALTREYSDTNFPYNIGINGKLGKIMGGTYYDEQSNNTLNSYYYFYNWNVDHVEVICESERKNISANITQKGDEEVESLPFSHSENTATYGNSLSGSPGEGCGGINENYLNGNEVIYRYKATDDEIINIELTDLNKFYAGLFVYDSCSDIGITCIAGQTAGPSMDNIAIKDLKVEKGETYYIVVSSWINNAIDYTINIKRFDCTKFEAPIGDSNQYFAVGETLSDLHVETTRPDANITWYANPELTNKIESPSLTSLVNGSKYYVTQTYNNCESSALEIMTIQLNCSDLSITSIASAEVVCSGSMTLQATPSNIGNQVYWYEDEIENKIIGRGNSFETPNLFNTKSYWVSEAYTKDIEPIKGQAKNISTNASRSSRVNTGLYFEAYKPFKIFDVKVYSTGPSTPITIELIDEADNVIDSQTETIPVGTPDSPSPYKVPLDFYVPKEGTYRLMIVNSMDTFSMLRESPVFVSFPYPLASFGEITDGANAKVKEDWYNYLYNWTIGDENIVCESPRKEVIAKVNQISDIRINHTDLPYLDQDNTIIYNNTFSGTPGERCFNDKYLDGYDSTYHYSSDPNNDNILQIQLSDVDNLDAAVFVYKSCGNIGIECIDGATIHNGKAIIENVYIPAGEEVIIVVSSLTGNTEYTLLIDGIHCESLNPPTAEVSPSFIQGETVADLRINESEFTQEITWYRDENLTDQIKTPSSEYLKSGNSYFVTQTIVGCESKPLEIKPVAIDCESSSIIVNNKNNYICAPGGRITLEVESKGVGSDIYWYDSKTDGNIIGAGQSIEVFVDQDSSFWVSEVQTRSQGTPGNQILDTYCEPHFNSSFPCQNGDNINDFILKDNSNKILISHLNTGCSAEGYGNYIDYNYLHATLYAGETYSFEVTHEDIRLNNYVRIWIDYNGNGSFEDVGELVYEAEVPGSLVVPSVGSFKVPKDIVSNNTIMRVKNTFLNNLNINSCTQPNITGEVHDYKVVVLGADIICESSREEVSVIINNSHTKEPTVSTQQTLCGNPLLSDIRVLGHNIKWYNSKGHEIDENSLISTDEFYYVTQTINGCESALKEVIINVIKDSNLPVASINQTFNPGDTLEDLDVSGTELTWYKDQWKSKELPLSTPLKNQQTYYVTQVEEGKCESDPLGITAYEILDVKDILFSDFNFYPNPVDNTLYISNAHVINKIEIYDITGRNISSHYFNDLNLTLDVSKLSPGTYLLNVQVENETKNFRIVKK